MVGNIKTLLSNKGHLSIPPLKHEGRIVTEDAEKTEIFNHFFSQQCQLPETVGIISLPQFFL